MILLKGGKVLRNDTISKLTDEISPSVSEVVCDMDEIMRLEEKYLISNIVSDGKRAWVRLISDKGIDGWKSAPGRYTITGRCVFISFWH